MTEADAIECPHKGDGASRCTICRGHGELTVISSRRSTCPVCAGHLIPIAYGLPGLELFEEWESGRVELGGCEIHHPDVAPKMRCVKCRRGFVLSSQIDEAHAVYEAEGNSEGLKSLER